MGHMIIDGRKVEFTDEKKCPVCHPQGRDQYSDTVLPLRGIHFLVPVVYVQLKMRGEKHLPHVLNSQEMEW